MPGTMPGMPLSTRTKIIGALGAGGMGAAVLAILVGSNGSGVIPQEEGRRNRAYLDPVGIPTICEGWTHGVRLGQVATDAECDELTLRGIDQALDVFMRHVPQHVREQMPAETVAAFLSFIYNVGPGRAGVKDGFVWLKNGRNSTMLRHLQAGRIEHACLQMQYWVSAQGVRLRGLVNRRQREIALCVQHLKRPPEQIRALWHGPAPTTPAPAYDIGATDVFQEDAQ